MASACVNSIGMSPESFRDCPPVKYSSYGWLSPRISFSHEIPDEEPLKIAAAEFSEKNHPAGAGNVDDGKAECLDPDISSIDLGDFEFRLEDPVAMLPADELFADGKLMPLHLSSARQLMTADPASNEVRLPEPPKFRRRNEISSTDPYLFSPKAPRCSSRWKELLGLKKLYQNSNVKQEDRKAASSLSTSNNNRNAAKSLKQLLHRGTKSAFNESIDSSLNLPLLKDLDNESLSISSRLSLSSSSSGHEHDDLPRLSLDSEKPSVISRNTHQTTRNISRGRLVHHRALSSESQIITRAGRKSVRKAPEPPVPVTGAAVDSPRMNSSGKIVFHSLERSSSSPGSFNGGSRYKYRGMERSYSANVRVTPVLNVPVCSLRGSSKSGVFGFPMFSSHQKKEGGGGGGGGGAGGSGSGSVNTGGNRALHNHGKNRTDRA